MPTSRALRFAVAALALAVAVTAAPAAATPRPATLYPSVNVQDAEGAVGAPGWDPSLDALGVVASVTANGAVGPLTVTFDWGDGTRTTLSGATEVDTNHEYAGPGQYPLNITTTDGTSTAPFSTVYRTAGTAYTPITPTRILDTRTGTGLTGGPRKEPARTAAPVRVTGVAGVPNDGSVAAVVLTVTATDTTTAGYVAVSPEDTTQVTTDWSNLNFAAGQTVANLTTVQTYDGSVSVGNGSNGTTDLIVDIAGYYRWAAGNAFTATTATRILDTRDGTGHSGAVPARQSLSLPIEGNAGLPASGVTAVALNVTATASTTAGYVTVWPDGATRPTASSLNYAAGQTVAGLVVVPVGADGAIDLYNGSDGPLHLIADVSGNYTANGGYHFVPSVPTRLLDTRTANGPIAPRTARIVRDYVVGSAKIDVANVTATDATAAGYLTAVPYNDSLVNTSSLNYAVGQTVANLAVSPTADVTDDQDRCIQIYNGSSGRTDAIVDLFGWFN